MYKVLDHYYLYLKNNCYAVVVGNTHSNSFIIGYVKYCGSSRETIWCSKYDCYERLVKYYDKREVYNSTPWKTFIPNYGSETPIIPISMISKVYDPRYRVKEIIEKPRDILEKNCLEILFELCRNIRLDSIGLTGTLLIGIHNPKYSDIDLVIYDLKDSRDTIEFIVENPSLFKSLSGDRLKNWCERVFKVTNIDPKTIYKLYRVWRRGLFTDIEYSFIFNKGVFEYIDNGEKWVSIGVFEGFIEFESSLDALNYPSKGFINKWVYRKGFKPRSDLEYVLSFETLFTPLFYEGGKCITRSLLQYNPLKDTYRLLIGVYEQHTYIELID